MATPPNIAIAKAFLMKSFPYILGAIELNINSRIFCFFAKRRSSILSSSVSSLTSISFSLLMQFASMNVVKTGNEFFKFAL